MTGAWFDVYLHSKGFMIKVSTTGMAVSLKTDLRFPISGQWGHGDRIIQAIEFNKGNGRRTHIFYCDPQRSDQKGGCEVTHEMIRRVLPKKTSFDNLTQDDINLMMSHINSYNRKKLNNQSAHQLFSFINGGDILDKLGIKSIPANEINLTPLLLKK